MKRLTDGIANAKSKGVIFGAKPKLTKDQISEMNSDRESGVLIKNLMIKYSISKATVYRLLNDFNAG